MYAFRRHLVFICLRWVLILVIALTGIGTANRLTQAQDSAPVAAQSAPVPPETHLSNASRLSTMQPSENARQQLAPKSVRRINAPSGFPPLENISKISTNGFQTCALVNPGAVKCWGSNSDGQLGNNDTLDSSVPVDVSGLQSGIIAVATGYYHACALTSAGAVKCWGSNSGGQLGNSSVVSSNVPVDVSGLSSGVVAISAGGSFTCARTNFGAAKCWGYNNVGQLGNNDTVSSSVPVNVVGLGSGVSAISLGYAHACALTNIGAIKCWGSNTYGQLGDNSTTTSGVPVDVFGLSSNMSEISVGAFHTCARTSTGALKCWGYNGSGQLGNNSTANSSVPADVNGMGSGVIAIANGGYHVCALINTGAVKCWGYNLYGQLGNNSTTNSSVAVDVNGLGSGSGISAITTGLYQSCALTNNSTAKCWGGNAQGQLGIGTAASSFDPVNVSGLGSAMRAVTTGAFHACALSDAGVVRCWGRNVEGELGNTSTENSTIPVDVSGLGSGASAISAGGYHSCGLTNSGVAQCWGYNYYGQLGNTSTTNSSLPVDVSGLGSAATAIASGTYHTCALASGSAAKCWGYNGDGELGNGGTTSSTIPVNVSGLGSGVSAIATRAYHTCALIAGGVAKCWGYNGYGELGNGGVTSSPVPVNVSGLGAGLTGITVGGYHTCALTSSGAVKCWGRNTEGQLGSSSTVSSSVPVDVTGLSSGVTQITAGDYHTCAVTSVGAAKCWGWNGEGQLGNGNTISSSVPVDVTDLQTGVSAISAGYAYTCVRTQTGAIKCWGAGDFGQLGDGSAWKATPVDVVANNTAVPGITYLPLAYARYPVYFDGPLEQEPNDTPAMANGPIRLNTVYNGQANDQSDYYYFNLTTNGTVIVTLNGHNAEDAKCNQQPCLQLHLRDSANTLLTYDFQKPYQIISPNLTAGLYYVRIFDASGAHNLSNLYSLSVSAP